METKSNKNLPWLILFTVFVIFAAEMIGFQSIKVATIKFNFLPLVFAITIAMICGLPFFRKGFMKNIFSDENVEFAGKNMIFIMLPLMAKYGADVAPKFQEIMSIGWVFLSQEIGNLGTILFGLPIALMLGLRREAIGCTLGLGREGELAYITEKYTLDSPEGRGVISLYIIGTLFGAVFYSIIAPVFLNFGFRIEALAMACGMGSASMMAGASSALIATMPEQKELISAYAAASQLLTSFLGTFSMIFLAAPLQKFMYNTLLRGKDKI